MVTNESTPFETAATGDTIDALVEEDCLLWSQVELHVGDWILSWILDMSLIQLCNVNNPYSHNILKLCEN